MYIVFPLLESHSLCGAGSCLPWLLLTVALAGASKALPSQEICNWRPGRQGAGFAPMAKSGCFQGTGSGSGRAWPPLNVLSWLSALGGVASGSWERASGFGPWDSWPPERGFSHAPLAVSPAAVRTQD